MYNSCSKTVCPNDGLPTRTKYIHHIVEQARVYEGLGDFW
jgi:hypothetical protein